MPEAEANPKGIGIFMNMRTQVIFLLIAVFLSCTSAESNHELYKYKYRKEVVLRTALKLKHSRVNESSKAVLTESGKIFGFEDDEKGFFLEKGDTVLMVGDKIVKIIFKN